MDSFPMQYVTNSNVFLSIIRMYLVIRLLMSVIILLQTYIKFSNYTTVLIKK